MIDPKKIEQLAQQIQGSLPQGIRNFGEDVEKKIKQLLQAQFARLDLVSQEEFAVQTELLLRTREKLSQLTEQVALLEEKLAATNPKHDKK